MYFYLKKTKSEKPTLIYLKYKIKGEKRFVFYIDRKVCPIDWDFINKWVLFKRGRNDLVIIDRTLKYYKLKLDNLILKYDVSINNLTYEILNAEFNEVKINPEKSNLIDCINKFIRFKTTGKKNSDAKNVTLKNNLIKFQNRIGVNLTIINLFETHRLVGFYQDELKYNDNTTYREMSRIKEFLRWSFKQGMHNYNVDDFQTKTVKQYEPDHIALNKEQIDTIYNFVFIDNLNKIIKACNDEDNLKPIAKARKLQRIIDLFLVGCLTGQRYQNFHIFDKLDYHNGQINVRQDKTKQQVIIPVDANPKLHTILTKYNFNLPTYSIGKFNMYLKEALMIIGGFDKDIKKTSYRKNIPIITVNKYYNMVSSHTARRTFISITLNDGWTYKEVMRVSGIKNIRTLIKYDKISSDRLNKKSIKTWGNKI